MALYDSSQLLNIVNSANAYYSSMYPALNAIRTNSSNPFGLFNDFSKIKLNNFPPINGFSLNAYSGTSQSSSSSSLHSEMLDDLYSSDGSSSWAKWGYDASAGTRLASVARKNSHGFSGYCARYVKDAISDAGLGSWVPGHAYQMDDILRRNPNFREIPASTNVKSLPAGCVLVFNQGSRGYSSKYGHTEITDGKGHGISDGITRNLRQPDAIFMPVAA